MRYLRKITGVPRRDALKMIKCNKKQEQQNAQNAQKEIIKWFGHVTKNVPIFTSFTSML